jgi:phage anti-repressor protein
MGLTLENESLRVGAEEYVAGVDLARETGLIEQRRATTQNRMYVIRHRMCDPHSDDYQRGSGR